MYSLLTCLWSGDDIVGWAPFVLFVYLGRIIESLYTILKDEAAQKNKGIPLSLGLPGIQMVIK